MTTQAFLGSAHFAPERTRIAHQAQQSAVEQQVNHCACGRCKAQPGGLASPARTQEQEGARRQGEAASKHRRHYNGKNAGELYTASNPIR